MIRDISVGTNELVIRDLDPTQTERWDAFVQSCPEATFFHRAGWQQVITRSFGHATYFLYAEQNGEIAGVLPLGHVRSRIFGNALISLPFCVYGGVAASSDAARSALINAATELAKRLGVDYLEMRNRAARCCDWKRKELYVTFRKTIDADPEVNLKQIPRKQRAMVSKGIKAGLHGEHDLDIDRFYEAYASSVHNLGTPVFPKRYFRILKEVFDQDCDILTITKDGRPVSSVLSFYFRDEVLPYYGGGTHEARELKANDFMYWELMQTACQNGVRVFDYGRSKQGTGSYSFKKNWGFEPEPLHYEYFLVKAREVPEVNPLNPKYRIFISIWKRMPFTLTKLIGPILARSLG